MQQSKNYSFSVKNRESVELVDKLKRDCEKTGRKFSWLVLEALKLYKAESNEKDK